MIIIKYVEILCDLFFLKQFIKTVNMHLDQQCAKFSNEKWMGISFENEYNLSLIWGPPPFWNFTSQISLNYIINVPKAILLFCKNNRLCAYLFNPVHVLCFCRHTWINIFKLEAQHPLKIWSINSVWKHRTVHIINFSTSVLCLLIFTWLKYCQHGVNDILSITKPKHITNQTPLVMCLIFKYV